MMRKSWVVLFCLALPVGCGGDSDTGSEPTDEERDAAAVPCVQTGNKCCWGSFCSTLTLTCPSGQTPTYTCSFMCRPQGTCGKTPSPGPSPTIQDATVTLVGNGMKGFEVKVDGVSIGKEGTTADSNPAAGNFTFKVKGDANHNIWITDGFYVYQSNGYFPAGRAMTINLTPQPLPTQVTVIINANWAGYRVWLDGKDMGYSTGAVFSFKVQAAASDVTHVVDVYDGTFHYKKDVLFKKGISQITINVAQASEGWDI